MCLLSGSTFVVGGVIHVHNVASHSSIGPEFSTSAIQPGILNSIPFLFYVLAGRVSIESREASAMFKDLVSPAGHDGSVTFSAFVLGSRLATTTARLVAASSVTSLLSLGLP